MSFLYRGAQILPCNTIRQHRITYTYQENTGGKKKTTRVILQANISQISQCGNEIFNFFFFFALTATAANSRTRKLTHRTLSFRNVNKKTESAERFKGQHRTAVDRSHGSGSGAIRGFSSSTQTSGKALCSPSRAHQSPVRKGSTAQQRGSPHPSDHIGRWWCPSPADSQGQAGWALSADGAVGVPAQWDGWP